MAEIVFGFGTSHGPLLATPPHEWDLRANVDRKNKALAYRDGTFDFEQLYQLRKNDHFETQNANDVRAERNDRCQKQLDVIGERLKAVNPDALVIIGDDHHEWFLNDIQPTFSIFHGKQVFNRALTKAEEETKIANGGGYAMKIYYPQKDEIYPCPTDLATHMVNHTVQNDFDITALGEQPGRQWRAAPARAFLRLHLSPDSAQQAGPADPDPRQHLLPAEPANAETLHRVRPGACACHQVL